MKQQPKRGVKQQQPSGMLPKRAEAAEREVAELRRRIAELEQQQNGQ